MLNKIVLFYGFAPLADPTAVMLWQRALAERHGLKGRVIVSPHGINATVGGPIGAVKQYVRTTREHPAFAEVEIKWSNGSAEDFPRLSVKVRPELVTFGVPEEIAVDETGVVGGGEHLSPGALHRLMEQRDDVVLFDGRNSREAEIGRFKDAVVPEAETTKDLLAQLDSGAFDHLKDRPVVTYCTGGIRCEVLSTLMRHRGFQDVYQLDGGIVKYGETFGNAGLWEGSLYVFDRRMHVEFGSGAESLGSCTVCGDRTPLFANCADPSCRAMRLVCEPCQATPAGQRCAEHPALLTP